MTPIALVFSIHWVAERVKLGMQRYETIWKQKRNQRDISKNILLIVWNEEYRDYLLLLVKIHHLAKLIEWHSAILE